MAPYAAPVTNNKGFSCPHDSGHMTTQTKRHRWTRWAGAALAVALIGGAAWHWQRSSIPDAKVEPAAQAATAEPDLLRYPAGSAQLQMLRVVEARASGVPVAGALSARVAYDEDVTAKLGVSYSGRIVAVRAAPGDHVRAGQVLAEIDSPDFGTARADVDKAAADLRRKRLATQRLRDLATDDGIPARDLEAMEADLSQAEAELIRAQQRLRNLNPHALRIDGQRLKLVSPIDGVVTERSASPALEVAPGMAAPLFVVSDTRRLWLIIDMPERLLARVKPGAMASVESDAYPERRFSAQIMQLGQAVDPNTRRVPIRAAMSNAGGELLPEMYVRALLLQESGKGFRIPNEALVNRGVQQFIFVEEATGSFRRRQVKLLAQGSDASYVGDGLNEGERYVTAGALLLDAELTARAAAKP
ncbi:efflux RND transporter periplasmic adaptor subunit [uncultured Pseudacidovorax sp.]|uniref:efflux RND transporter periplasmic adaptor subunit n=1 Tax=uncultured Pseudacidovorax sp. TaxID=679313 RepID=UPI0025CD7444|nr:efflux RND transporter periplasmic adaptor subunit [uncultured Pseudacidovorax sp.]